MNRIVGHSWLTARVFGRARRGSIAVETAVAVSVLVFALAGLIEIVHSAYVSDKMSRAARAAARAIAVTPEATGSDALGSIACAAIRRELRLTDDFDCGASWTITVDTNLTPASLADAGATTASTGGATNGGTGGATTDGDADGDIVLVRIAWNWELGRLVSSLDDDYDAHPRIAVGVARLEPVTGS